MIKNLNLSNTWSLACYAVDKYGIVVPSGPNYTSNLDYTPPLIKEVRCTIEYGEDAIKQMFNKTIHALYPHQQGIDEYINQFIPGTEEYEHGRTFHYSYGLRLREMKCPFIDVTCNDEYNCTNPMLCNNFVYNEDCYLDQLKFISEHMDSFNKRLQAVTWISEIDLPSTIMDEMVQSVPCLRSVRLENYYDKYYVILTTWRSRDICKASIWNTIGYVNAIDQLVQESREKLKQPKLKLVQVVEMIESLHAYEADWDVASKVPIDAKSIENCLFI